MDKNIKTYTVDEAKILLEKYCIYHERSHQDVINRLYKMHMILEAREVILLHLLQNDYLNEERFAKSFTRGKFNQNKWGKIKIKNQLKYKQISNVNIEIALKEIIQKDYLDVLQKLVVKKINTTKAKNKFDQRKKVIYFLQSKGFEISLILDALDNVTQKNSI